jgi:hypothetical protein
MPSFIVPEENSQLTPGVHRMEVVEAVEKISKTGNEMIEIKLQSEKGGTVKDYLVFSTKAAFKIRDFLEAAGKTLTTGARLDLTAKQCLELKPMFALVGPDEAQPQYMRVKKYLKKEQVAQALASVKTNDDFDEIPF